MNIILKNEATESLILAQLQKEIMERQEEVIKKAVEEYEAKLRSNLGQIVLDMSRHYTVQTLHDEIVITVRNKR